MEREIARYIFIFFCLMLICLTVESIFAPDDCIHASPLTEEDMNLMPLDEEGKTIKQWTPPQGEKQ